MSIHLIRDLETLHRDLLSMGGVVEEMVHQAVEALGRPNGNTSRELARRDDEIDQWDVRIEDECLKMFALHQPVAIDLRRIATVLKICGELERVADLAVHITERAAVIASWPQLVVPDRLKKMGQIAVDMLHRSIDAYVELNSQEARAVCAEDDTVDELNREIIDEITNMMKRDPELIEPGTHVFSATRHIERIADHATNIAEDVVYLVEGAIIRHRSGPA
jgi:phosphate transport system protein